MNENTFSGPVSRHLRRGQDGAILAADLAKIAGFASTRTLRRAISRERAEGVPILSDTISGGYFLPSTGERGREELAAFVERSALRSICSLARLRPLRSQLDQCSGQTQLSGVRGGGERNET